MKKLIAPLVLLVCGLVFLGGCSNTSKIIAVGLRPEITLIERANGDTPAVTWQIVNTNVVAYLLSRIEHKVYLNGQLIGTTRNTTPLALPKHSAAGATNDLQFAPNGAAILRAAAGTDATYRVETAITIQIYGDTTEKSVITNSGTVRISAN